MTKDVTDGGRRAAGEVVADATDVKRLDARAAVPDPLPEGGGIIDIVVGLQRADASVGIASELEILRLDLIGGLERAVKAVQVGKQGDARGGGVDHTTPLSPATALVVVAVAQHILAANVDLVESFQVVGQLIAPGGGRCAGAGECHRLPAAIERSHGYGVETGGVDFHFVQATVEIAIGAVARAGIAQRNATLRRQRRGTDHAGGRAERPINVEAEGRARGQGQHGLMPLAVAVVLAGGANFIALHPLDKGADIAVDQIERTVGIAPHGAGGSGKETAVRRCGVKPEADGEIGFRDVGCRRNDIVGAVKLHGTAIDAGGVIDRAAVAGATAIGAAARAIGIAANALRLVEIVEGVRRFQRVEQIGWGEGDLQLLHAAGKAAGVGGRTGEDHIAGDEGGRFDQDIVAIRRHLIAVGEHDGGGWRRVNPHPIDEIVGFCRAIRHIVGGAHGDGVLAGCLIRAVVIGVKGRKRIGNRPVAACEGGGLPASGTRFDQHFHGLDTATGLPDDGGIIHRAIQRQRPAILGVALGRQDRVARLAGGQIGRGGVDKDGCAGRGIFDKAHGVGGAALDLHLAVVVRHLPNIGPGAGAGGRRKARLPNNLHFHAGDIRSRVGGCAADGAEAAGLDILTARQLGGGAVIIDAEEIIFAKGQPRCAAAGRILRGEQLGCHLMIDGGVLLRSATDGECGGEGLRALRAEQEAVGARCGAGAIGEGSLQRAGRPQRANDVVDHCARVDHRIAGLDDPIAIAEIAQDAHGVGVEDIRAEGVEGGVEFMQLLFHRIAHTILVTVGRLGITGDEQALAGVVGKGPAAAPRATSAVLMVDFHAIGQAIVIRVGQVGATANLQFQAIAKAIVVGVLAGGADLPAALTHAEGAIVELIAIGQAVGVGIVLGVVRVETTSGGIAQTVAVKVGRWRKANRAAGSLAPIAGKEALNGGGENVKRKVVAFDNLVAERLGHRGLPATAAAEDTAIGRDTHADVEIDRCHVGGVDTRVGQRNRAGCHRVIRGGGGVEPMFGGGGDDGEEETAAPLGCDLYARGKAPVIAINDDHNRIGIDDGRHHITLDCVKFSRNAGVINAVGFVEIQAGDIALGFAGGKGSPNIRAELDGVAGHLSSRRAAQLHTERFDLWEALVGRH